ncbi:MAG: phospholipid-binding lipoprotein MlaA [Candidatus Nitrotoga sp. LAW]|nr:MAG: phospholipid-binding lipoprotein MlaA [Candidatus Nitrotoga sp. LAW]
MSSTRIYLLLISLALSGCAATQGDAIQGGKNPHDPLEPFNRRMYKFNDAVDKAILKPVATGYNTTIPEPGKIMVRNFFSNLDDIIVTINDLLQLKFTQAASDGTRVLFNSTFGILGLINVTDRLEKHNEDFGQTLGYWGVSSGPYIVLPFFGPRTIRDSAGLYVDSYASPIRLISDIPVRNEMYVTRTVSLRAGLLDQEKILDEAAIDRYTFIRDAYLQQRQSLVYDGNPPREKFDDEDNSGPIEESKENEQQTVVSTPVPPHTMEPPTQKTSSDPTPGVAPADIVVPADTSFNPYKMEEPTPTTTNPVVD